MNKVDELATKVALLEKILAESGIRLPDEGRPDGRGTDYIAHGSPEHAAFLGLVEMGEGDKTVTLATFTSPRTGRVYRLEDELGAVQHYPGIDPAKAVALVLQQKVNELEIAPAVPADAPAPFRPAAVYPS